MEQNIERLRSLLNDGSLSDLQRKEQLHDVMTGLLDLHRIALFALGPYAKRASRACLDQFEDAFTGCSIEIYQSALARFKELTFRVSGSTRYAGDDVVVRGEFSSPDRCGDRRRIPIEFRVRKTAAGQHAVTDIGVEGFWIALWQRADIMGFMHEHDGDIEVLTEHFRVQNEDA